MLIDLHALLSAEGKVKQLETDLELQVFTTKKSSFTIIDKKPLEFVFTNLGGGKVQIDCHIDVTLLIPCDRCLEDVKTQINIQTSREVNLSETDVEEKDFLDEADFIEGTEFDVEKFAYGEILVNLPMKVLCSENCKGICNRCGTNLNHESCGCDTTELDPRMAKALEVFNSFKEV
jgi:uncharacterized protein